MFHGEEKQDDNLILPDKSQGHFYWDPLFEIKIGLLLIIFGLSYKKENLILSFHG